MVHCFNLHHHHHCTVLFLVVDPCIRLVILLPAVFVWCVAFHPSVFVVVVVTGLTIQFAYKCSGSLIFNHHGYQ
jgi:hypothetical protein